VIGVLPGILSQGAALDFASVILADSPAGWWRLNETSGTAAADSSGNGNHGVYHSGTTLAQSGPGSDATMEISSPTGGMFASGVFIAANQPVSLEAWIYVVDMASIVNAAVSVGSGGFTGLFAPYSDTNYYFDNRDTGAETIYNRVNTVGGTSVANGEWHHVVGVAENGRQELWLDGAIIAASAIHILPSTSRSGLSVGYYYDGSAFNHFPGRVGDVAVYLSALSGTRINAHRTARLAS
jgi:hypothetical protein